MTMEVVWYTAASIDGRIADAHDALDFLTTIPEDDATAGEFATFLKGVDAAIVGAHTLRWLVRHGHGWPHGDLPTWVVSHDPGICELEVPTRAPLHRVEGDISVVVDRIEASGAQRVWLCGGGDIAGQLLRCDRVDDIVVTMAPTVLGSGPSLVDGVDLPRRAFRLIECRPFSGNAVRLHWRRERPHAIA